MDASGSNGTSASTKVSSFICYHIWLAYPNSQWFCVCLSLSLVDIARRWLCTRTAACCLAATTGPDISTTCTSSTLVGATIARPRCSYECLYSRCLLIHSLRATVALRSWSSLVTEGPAPIPRDSHVAVIHSNSMYIFGGSTGSAMNDFYELNLGASYCELDPVWLGRWGYAKSRFLVQTRTYGS